MNEKKVYIIVVNWNGAKDTIECLESIAQSSYKNYNVIVVDNGSTDSSIHHIISRFPNLYLIEAKTNLGFTGGNNLGIKSALNSGADFVWLLNNDTIIERDTLKNVIELASLHKNSGIFGSMIFDYPPSKKIQFAGATIDWENAISPHLLKYDANIAIDRVNGCAMLVSRDVCEIAGVFDDNYFLYAEEVDWCIRAKNAGFCCIMCPSSIVFHKGSVSVERAGGKKIIYHYYNTRNFLYLINKLCPLRQKKLIIAKLVIKYVWENKKMSLLVLLDSFRTVKRIQKKDAPVVFAVKDFLQKNMGHGIF